MSQMYPSMETRCCRRTVFKLRESILEGKQRFRHVEDVKQQTAHLSDLRNLVRFGIRIRDHTRHQSPGILATIAARRIVSLVLLLEWLRM